MQSQIQLTQVGLVDGEYIFAKNNIIKENKSVKIKKDGTLAGSIITMDQTLKI